MSADSPGVRGCVDKRRSQRQVRMTAVCPVDMVSSEGGVATPACLAEGRCGMDKVGRVRESVHAELGPPGTWPTWRGGWPGEADTALVDSVFSTRARYDTVVLPLVERWRAAPEHSPDGRLAALRDVDRDRLLAIVDNRQLVPGRAVDRPVKVDAVREVASRLVDHGIDTAADVRSRAERAPGELKRLFTGTSGVGKATYRYFLMLLGVPGVKADTMVVRFLTNAIGRDVSQSEAERFVTEAASQLEVGATELDHAIWRYQSGMARAR